MKVRLGISNRHVHLTKEDLEILFGKGYFLTAKNILKQPGQYASNDVVTIKTEKASIDNVRIIGGIRPYTQVEITKTDAYKLGINPPVRESGDLQDAEEITIVSNNASIKREACILANRHVHISNKQMKDLGLSKDDTFKIKITNERGGEINNIKLKPTEDGILELHLDTDEANAFLLKNTEELELIKN